MNQHSIMQNSNIKSVVPLVNAAGCQDDLHEETCMIDPVFLLRSTISSFAKVSHEGSRLVRCRYMRRHARLVVLFSVLPEGRRVLVLGVCGGGGVMGAEKEQKTKASTEGNDTMHTHHHHHHHHQSLNRKGHWGTTDDFATSFLQFSCSPLPSGTCQTPGLSIP